MKRLISWWGAVLGLAFLLTAGAEPVSASCTNNYYLCLNEATFAGGYGIEPLESVECGAAWAGCVGRSLRFW